MEHTPHEGGEHQLPGAEHQEKLLINSVVIPANDDGPVRQQQLGNANLDEYQELVGGRLEVVNLKRPVASLYCNEDGKLFDLLPINGRATLLLWMHCPALRFRDYVVGDIILTGPPTCDGWDTDVFDELTRLFDARTLRIEVQTYGDPQWYGNDLRFGDWTEAYAYGLDLAHRWSAVEDVRVLPVEMDVPEQPGGSAR